MRKKLQLFFITILIQRSTFAKSVSNENNLQVADNSTVVQKTEVSFSNNSTKQEDNKCSELQGKPNFFYLLKNFLKKKSLAVNSINNATKLARLKNNAIGLDRLSQNIKRDVWDGYDLFIFSNGGVALGRCIKT